MKKIVLAIAVIATVTCFSSCTKKCSCTSYLLGNVTGTEEIELNTDKFDKCSDMNTVVTLAGTKSGVECEPTL